MKRYRVKPGARIDLAKIDAGSTQAFIGSKKKAEEQLLKLSAKLERLQDALWAEHKH